MDPQEQAEQQAETEPQAGDQQPEPEPQLDRELRRHEEEERQQLKQEAAARANLMKNATRDSNAPTSGDNIASRELEINRLLHLYDDFTTEMEHELAREVLQLAGIDPSDLTQELVTRHWKRICLRCHPDKVGDDRALIAKANAATKVIHAAKDRLFDYIKYGV